MTNVQVPMIKKRAANSWSFVIGHFLFFSVLSVFSVVNFFFYAAMFSTGVFRAIRFSKPASTRPAPIS
jgi:hypothetical protein